MTLHTRLLPRRLWATAFLALLLHATFTLHAATRVEIGVLPGLLKYNVTSFEVPAGGEVELVFNNNGLMQHNLLITERGRVDAVVLAAMNLGERGFELKFVPETEDVLHATDLVSPGQSETLTFTAPSEVGEYPYVCTFPGHGNIMRGVMRVKASGSAVAEAVTIAAAKTEVVDTFADVEYDAKPQGTPERPLVVRTFMPNPQLDFAVFARHDRGMPASQYSPAEGADRPGIVDPTIGIPAAIGVNFGDQLSYCWDTTECRLLYAWNGGFLDMANYWGEGAGGGRKSFDYVPEIEGRVFYKAIGSHPFGGEDKPVRYLGHRLEDNVPVFAYMIGDLMVHEKITPAGRNGLSVYYHLHNAPARLELKWDMAARAMIRCDKGRWEGNTLVLEGVDAESFTLNISR